MDMGKVVARFKDGTLKKGKTSDFSPDKMRFHLHLFDGEIVDIDVERLKAVFFVADFEGDKRRQDAYDDVIPGGGRKMRLEFSDGEVITGYSQGYSPDRPGFFVMPADLRGNNKRIFAIKSATKNVSLV